MIGEAISVASQFEFMALAVDLVRIMKGVPK